MSKIKVPKEMLAAVYTDKIPCSVKHQDMEKYLESALRWLTENFIRPSDEKFGEMVKERHDANPKHWESLTEWDRTIILICEWQRRMFLAPDSEVPISPPPDIETIEKAYQDINQKQLTELVRMRARVDRLEWESLRRGQKDGSK